MVNRIQTLRPALLFGLLVLVQGGLAGAQAPPLWGKLSPGTHAVGFKSLWQLDYARRYNMTFDDKTTYAPGKAPRPILVNVWYPARKVGAAKAMPHRDYLNIQSPDPPLARFAAKLAEYDRAVMAQEAFGKPVKELTEREQQLFQRFVDTPTTCVRDAPPKDGPFPVVIYHAGHGSSFEDNSVLCEFLASHGYVVLGSAFQEPGGSSFNVDGKLTSAGDMQFLIAYAKHLPYADWHHVGVIGHSGGAHAALTFRAQAGCTADAVVSLDTTQDYYAVADPRWEPLTAMVTRNRQNMTGPLLMVANPHAFFQLADSLAPARRYYLTLKDLDHNDFIAQGVIGRELRLQLHSPGRPEATPGKPVAEVAEAKREAAAGRSGYEALCVYILRFLDAELKGDAAGKEYLETQYRDTKLEGAAPHAEYVPEGRTSPDLYPENSSQPPTPRQVRYYLGSHGGQKTLAVFRRFRKEVPEAPMFHHVFGLALVGELLDQGRVQDALEFHTFYREADIDCARALLEWGKSYLRAGRTRLAEDYFKKVLLLDPANREASDKLKEVGALEQKKDGK